MRLGRVAGLLSAMLGVATAQATTPSSPAATIEQPTAEVSSPTVAGRLMPANTTVMIAVDANLTSKTATKGTMFPLRLAEPVIVDGQTILPAGLTGEGEIIHVAKGGFGGRAGEMILAARYIDCGATRIPIGRFKFGVVGQSTVNEALAMSQVAGVFAGFIVKGGDVVVATGARATAQTKAEITLMGEGNAACQPAPASAIQPGDGDDAHE